MDYKGKEFKCHNCKATHTIINVTSSLNSTWTLCPYCNWNNILCDEDFLSLDEILTIKGRSQIADILIPD